jgi:hypothetical protein
VFRGFTQRAPLATRVYRFYILEALELLEQQDQDLDLLVMDDHLAAAENRLIQKLQLAVRGPKRNGLFALWLFLRACEGVLPPDPLSGRAHRRRLESLERRLSSLSLQPSLRQALAGSTKQLSEGTGDAAVTALKLLVAPVREAIGDQASDAITLAARTAKGTLQQRETVGS